MVVLLPKTEVSGAVRVAESMRQAVYDLKIRHPNSRVADVVTISAGVAGAVPNQLDPPEMPVRAADWALYKAKQGGRNKVVVKSDKNLKPFERFDLTEGGQKGLRRVPE